METGKERIALAIQAEAEARASGKGLVVSDQDRHGTVGAVALDRADNLAAATSTGGNTNKLPGRLGERPLSERARMRITRLARCRRREPENFMRLVAGHEISALMEYCKMPLQRAAQTVIAKVTKLGGGGGLIALDKEGNISLPFNTAGMYRGHVDSTGQSVIEIYK